MAGYQTKLTTMSLAGREGVRTAISTGPDTLRCSTCGIHAEDVVIARRRKVENDLGRLAERHAGTCVDVEATAHALAAGAPRAGDATQRGVERDQRGIDCGGASRQDRNAAARAVAAVAARPAGAADGLIVNEGAVGQRQRTIVRGTDR